MFAVSASVVAEATPPETEWTKSYVPGGSCIIRTHEGGYAIGGSTQLHMKTVCFFFKTDAA
jgi:hypothetical protein